MGAGARFISESAASGEQLGHFPDPKQTAHGNVSYIVTWPSTCGLLTRPRPSQNSHLPLPWQLEHMIAFIAPSPQSRLMGTL
jgi:hypothetical protein